MVYYTACWAIVRYSLLFQNLVMFFQISYHYHLVCRSGFINEYFVRIFFLHPAFRHPIFSNQSIISFFPLFSLKLLLRISLSSAIRSSSFSGSSLSAADNEKITCARVVTEKKGLESPALRSNSAYSAVIK